MSPSEQRPSQPDTGKVSSGLEICGAQGKAEGRWKEGKVTRAGQAAGGPRYGPESQPEETRPLLVQTITD